MTDLVEDAIYKILYKASILSDGVRCLNEDEWPIEELAKELAAAKEEGAREEQKKWKKTLKTIFPKDGTYYAVKKR